MKIIRNNEKGMHETSSYFAVEILYEEICGLVTTFRFLQMLKVTAANILMTNQHLFAPS